MASPSDDTLPIWIGAGVFGLVSLGLLVFGASELLTSRRWLSAATRVEGRVVDFTYRDTSVHGIKLGNKGEHGSVISMVVSYRVEGREIQTQVQSDLLKWFYKKGDPVAVLYQPAEPENGRVDSAFEFWLTGIAVCFIGLLFGAGAVAIVRVFS